MGLSDWDLGSGIWNLGFGVRSFGFGIFFLYCFMHFSYPYTIHLHDSDAAAMVYSANLIRICHEAYEAFMESIGFSFGRLFKERSMGFPLVHIEGDFQKILRVGDKVEIRVRIAELGHTSFRVAYELVKDNETYATANTVHVCVNPKLYQKMELPPEFRSELETYS